MIEALIILGSLGGYLWFKNRPAAASSILTPSTPPVMSVGAPGSSTQPFVPANNQTLGPGGTFTPSMPTTQVGGAQIGQALAGSAAAGVSAATGSVAIAGISGAALGAATAGIGAVAAIGIAMLAAHEARKRQATDENSAVNAAIAQVDQWVRTIFQGLNAHQIQPADAINFLGQAWAQYWSIIGSHIQPGRNGCMNGAAIKNFTGALNPSPGTGPGTLDADTYKGCGNISSWGAACCVGSVIKSSLANMTLLVYNPGRQARMVKIFPSKYGGSGRAAYDVTYNG